MLNLIKDILTSPAGSFASVFSLFALAFWLVHWITKKVTTIDNSHSNIKKSNEDAIKKIDKYCDKQDNNMDEIRKDIAFLKAMIDVFKSNPSQQVAQSHSPISLTEYGQQISTELNADEVIARNWDRIREDLESNVKDKNAYDIQQYCIETTIIDLSKFIDSDAVNAVKVKAYNEGRPVAFYAPVFGIKIRDRYLKEKGISVEEIDKHAPSPQEKTY